MRRKLALKYNGMTHPIHAILGHVLLVVLCALLATLALFVAFYAVKGLFISLFGHADEVPDVLSEEEKALYALPMGSPRGDGNNFYSDGWQKMTKEQADIVREVLGLKAKEGARDPEGWDVLMKQTDPTHPDMMLEVLNDPDGDYGGPDDVEEDEVEHPDGMVKYG